jgi:16S rRNA (cytosine967-C5)-methyltransferase
MSDGISARQAALGLLNSVLEEGALLQKALYDPNGPIAGLNPSERARAQRLCQTTLRHIEQADAVLAPYLRRTPPREVQNILRLAVVEMVVDGAAAHGVVNAAVALMRQGRKTTHSAGLANAVLRKIGALSNLFAKYPAQRLPYWLRKPLVDAYGRDVVSKIEAVQSQATPLDLTPMGTALWPEPGQVLPTGSIRMGPNTQVTAIEGYDKGAFWVQDAAAALAVKLLNAKFGERVLDLCAAPGGKTMQLAALGADVVALDISSPRLQRLHDNLKRTGLRAEVIADDALHWQPQGLFDCILLDAPCSATGTIRRHPDLPFVKDGSEIEELIHLQSALLDRALSWLRPGGRLVYCTCSLLPAEGEEQLSLALNRHPTLQVLPSAFLGLNLDWLAPEGGVRLRPDYWSEFGGMDGFFMVCLAIKQ